MLLSTPRRNGSCSGRAAPSPASPTRKRPSTTIFPTNSRNYVRRSSPMSAAISTAWFLSLTPTRPCKRKASLARAVATAWMFIRPSAPTANGCAQRRSSSTPSFCRRSKRWQPATATRSAAIRRWSGWFSSMNISRRSSGTACAYARRTIPNSIATVSQRPATVSKPTRRSPPTIRWHAGSRPAIIALTLRAAAGSGPRTTAISPR